MTIDETFNELYKLLRGSRSAPPLLDARALFESGKVSESIVEIRKIQEFYHNSRRAMLAAELGDVHPSDREAMQLKRRQAKSSDAIELMSELLDLLSIRERRLQAQIATAPTGSSNKDSVGKNAVVHSVESDSALDERSLKARLNSSLSEGELSDLLKEYFELVPVEQDHPFDSGQRFVVYTEGSGQIVEIDDPPVFEESLRVLRWNDRTRLLPIPISKFLRSASRERVFRLKNKTSVISTGGELAATDEPLVSDTAERDRILDMGAFTQLLDAAQRSGIVPGSGIIIQVRDCEFRRGRYNKALQMMESLYNSFVVAEMQRMQRLQREEADIASGRKKISPRELQAKRVTDNQNNMAIDRAKVRFQRVLEGLRGLLPMELSNSELDDQP